MKTADQFRSTNAFCITGGLVSDLAKISARFGRGLVAVARDTITDSYIVRVAEETRLVDYRVEVITDARILEETTITHLSKYASL